MMMVVVVMPYEPVNVSQERLARRRAAAFKLQCIAIAFYSVSGKKRPKCFL